MKQARLASTVQDIRTRIALHMARIDAEIARSLREPDAALVPISGDLAEIVALNKLLGDADAVRVLPKDGRQTDEFQAAHRDALERGMKGVEADTFARGAVR